MKKSIDQLVAEYAQGWKGWRVDGQGSLVRTKAAALTVLHTKGADAITSIKSALDPKQKLFIAGIANAYEVDRMNEIIDPVGLMADAYLKNPILLYQHDHRMPIGNLTMLKPENDGLHFEAWVGDPSAAELTDDQVKVRSLVAQRVLRACSIGFIPHKIRMPSYNEMGDMVEPAKIEKFEMLENSVVSVPANAGSIFDARAEKAKAPKKVWVFPAIGKDGRLQISTPFKQKLEAKKMELEELMGKQLAALNDIAKGINDLKTAQDSTLKAVEGLSTSIKAPKKPEAEPDEDDKKKAAEAAAKVALDAADARIKAIEETLKHVTDSLALIATKLAA